MYTWSHVFVVTARKLSPCGLRRLVKLAPLFDWLITSWSVPGILILGTLWKLFLECWLTCSLGSLKQELREEGRGSCSTAKNLQAQSSMYGNFSAFLIFSGNSCSLLAPNWKVLAAEGGRSSRGLQNQYIWCF